MKPDTNAAAITFTYTQAGGGIKRLHNHRFTTSTHNGCEKIKSAPIISSSNYTHPDPFSLKGILLGGHTEAEGTTYNMFLLFPFTSKICHSINITVNSNTFLI